jgi:hypothetical protein
MLSGVHWRFGTILVSNERVAGSSPCTRRINHRSQHPHGQALISPPQTSGSLQNTRMIFMPFCELFPDVLREVVCPRDFTQTPCFVSSDQETNSGVA